MQLQARIVTDNEFNEATKSVANTSSKKHESSPASKSEPGPSKVRRQLSEREVSGGDSRMCGNCSVMQSN